ncbi:hypothetical protein [Salipaludibacillus aurantiacus]|uniref:Uncharacterized protein n=1 Tax=Salipaludibacillus aurantiacus TaxID=1601833 RepID=A0A1H9UTQ9_9BACI|nr:hypothetical protein [Salipaludibacillus aurantiacus]SES12920.1 hypothetical protein SAMN05518684_108178 [Salipaludibacillus aurantiacus]
MQKIFEQYLVPIFAAAILFSSNVIFVYFFDNNAEVKIGTPTQVQEDSFAIPIDIHTFNEGISDLRIGIPVNINENNIFSNKPINIYFQNNNIGLEDSSAIIIEEIVANNNLQIILEVDQFISDQDIEVYSNKGNINVEYLSQKDSPVISQIKNLILYALLYAIILGIVTFFNIKDRDKKVEKVEEQHKNVLQTSEKTAQDTEKRLSEIKKELETDRLKLEKLEDKYIKHLNDSKKINILQKAKLNDYRKELSFWRDTIRKILYQMPGDEDKAKELIRIVTHSLKTFQTNEKNEPDFESLKVLTKMISDYENNNKN